MSELIIKELNEIDEIIGNFINEEFSKYGIANNISLNYDDYCFVIENKENELIGIISGHAYYNEVHISNLIINNEYRGKGLGRKLMEKVENHFKDKGYNHITVSTFKFQAPDFYKKLGYNIEFISNNENELLNKYYFKKKL